MPIVTETVRWLEELTPFGAYYLVSITADNTVICHSIHITVHFTFYVLLCNLQSMFSMPSQKVYNVTTTHF